VLDDEGLQQSLLDDAVLLGLVDEGMKFTFSDVQVDSLPSGWPPQARGSCRVARTS
jgi:hypothetical protein